MSLTILCLIFFCQVSSSVSKNDTQCIENPTGEVSLNVAVRGVPGQDGPQGHKGDIGPRGDIGLKGNKGQKGPQGIQGIPGPPGFPGLVGSQGIRGSPGHEGPQGPIGPPGQPGQTGPRGPQGRPGVTVLTEKEFNLVTSSVRNSVIDDVNTTVTNKFDDVCKKVENLNHSVLQAMKSQGQELLDIVMAELEAMNETLNMLKPALTNNTKCGICGNWKRIANFDTTQGDSCPTGLRTVTNSITLQKACGRTNTSAGCASFKFHNNMSYTNICGRVRGYQDTNPEAFYHHTLSNKRIDGPYANGILITQGSPRKHIWSYVAGISENQRYRETLYICPCARSTPSITSSDVPDFVGTHYYCESGHKTTSFPPREVIWEDPLWDGQGCPNSGNQCCNRYGWFHRQVQTSSEYIELRICADQGIYNEDIPIDQFEIWVM